MYTVDDRDEVLNFDGLPYHSAGAPEPQLLANDYSLVLAYETAPSGEEYAIVKFAHPHAHYFGSPNDEALSGHPLAKRGLRAYGIFEIRNSSWIRAMERMNRVHVHHDARRFDALRHFVFTFHDTTFECVANGVSLAATVPNEAETNLLRLMANHLR
jgi:hypothetical protein